MNALIPVVLISSLFATASGADAQSFIDCQGRGRAALYAATTNNVGLQADTDVCFFVAVPEGVPTCLVVARDGSPTVIPPIGLVCFSFNSWILTACGIGNDQNTFEIDCHIPPQYCGEFHSQVVTYDPGQPHGDFGVSNRMWHNVCFKCKDLQAMGLVTKVDAPDSYPAEIDIKLTDDDHDDEIYGQTVMQYDPNNPPTYPVTDGSGVYIDNIFVLGSELYIVWSADATLMMDGDKIMKKFKSNTGFHATVGGVAHDQVIHTSCSQTLSGGQIHGAFAITWLKPKEWRDL